MYNGIVVLALDE